MYRHYYGFYGTDMQCLYQRAKVLGYSATQTGARELPGLHFSRHSPTSFDPRPGTAVRYFSTGLREASA
eukprot:1075653-Rhodomonas_salina.3